MLTKLITAIGLFGLSLSLLSCEQADIPETISTEVSESITANEKITLGDISNKPFKKIQSYQPLADYLANNLKELGIKQGEVKIAPDLETMNKMLESGEVDIYFDSLYPAMILSKQTGAQAILRRWKKGIGEYHTMFLVRADSNINSLEQLSDQKIGLEEPLSTSGYFLPIVYLLEQGLNPVEKQSVNSPVQENEIAYIFTEKDENTIQWLVSDKIAVGAIDNGSFLDIPKASQQKLRIIAETESIARQIVLLRAELDSQQKEVIKNLLLKLDTTPQGKEILEKFELTSKFDEFPADDWQRMEKLYQVFQTRNQ